MSEHEKMSHGVCERCGGSTDADGYAMGGEIEALGDSDSGEFKMPPLYDRVEAEEREPTEDSHTEQQDRTEWMRAGAFSDAIARRGPVARVEPTGSPPAPIRGDDEEVRKKKSERYGFGGRR